MKEDTSGNKNWHTWIDYDRFQELAARNASDPTFTFSVQDYTAPTPSWALFGSEEEGFDPTDRRFRKANKHPRYTQFDGRGIPTHDQDDQPISEQERARLRKIMEDKIEELGAETTVTELKDGAKEVLDPRNMFRGMVVTK